MKTVVTTKFYGPTNTLGARHKVESSFGKVFVPFDYTATHQGVDEIEIAREFLRQYNAHFRGEIAIAVEEVEPVMGPGGLTYWIVTYDWL